MQSRRTRASRLVDAEAVSSTRSGIARSAATKPRTGAGLSGTAHPNIAKPSLRSASSKDTKEVVRKDVEKPSTTASAPAPSKRKREVSGDSTAKNGKTKPTIVTDKENHLQKHPTAYVEIPSHSSKTRSSSAISAPPDRKIAASSTTAGRSRIRVLKDGVKEEKIDEHPDEDGAMIIEKEITQERAARGSSSRIPMPGHPSGTTSRRVTTSKRVVSTSHPRRPVKLEEPEVEAVGRIAKKRRTSSVGPDDADQPRQGRSSLEESALAKETAAIEEVKWEDLDKEDEGDPLMVSEYVVDIFQYLLQLEQQTMPNPNYIDTQRDLAWKMRGILMDWLIQVHGRFRLLPETLFLAVNIVDRFLSARTVSLVRLQLVGITAIFIAAKYEEIMAPSLHNFIYCSDSTYEEKDIIEAEKYILKSLDWNLSYPNPIHFLRRASKADNYDLQVRTVAKYLIEISCVDWRLLPYPPSAIAAAGMWLARLILEKEEWTPNLEHYSGYSEEALLPGAQIMLAYLLRAVRHESFYKKYAAKKYMKVSAYVRDWAWAKFGAHEVDYDEEGEALTGIETHKNIVPQPASVTLFDVLPRLREEARLRKEAEKAAEDELGVLHEEDEE